MSGNDRAARARPAIGELTGAAASPAGAWLPGTDLDRPEPMGGADPPRLGWKERLRWDPGRRGAMALGLLVIAVVAATGWWLAAARPREVPVSGPLGSASPVQSSLPAALSSPTGAARSTSGGPSGGSAGSTAASASPSTGPPIVVDVAGKVRRPGIYSLPAGARVYDALRSAGGAKPGVSTLSINLAAPLHDGEQIVVGIAGTPALGGTVDGGASSGSGTGAAGSGSGGNGAVPVDLNTATLEQLETLPGVGPVLGQHILDWRDAHGHFTTLDQLREVSGIGDVRFTQLRPLVTL